MDLPGSAALWFLLAAVPAGLATVWSDLRHMKIPNRVTDALLAAFVPLGFLALPWQDALWHWTHPAVMLALGLGFHALRLFGAGDIKFLIAASPYVALRDLGTVMLILSACLLAGFALHRGARALGAARLTPGWRSWHDRKRFPMGIALGPALVIYLSLAAMG